MRGGGGEEMGARDEHGGGKMVTDGACGHRVVGDLVALDVWP